MNNEINKVKQQQCDGFKIDSIVKEKNGNRKKQLYTCTSEK